jgi:hypothetical protein
MVVALDAAAAAAREVDGEADLSAMSARARMAG